jgi:uncharacterized membrane protein YsdA (DUF1294 family)
MPYLVEIACATYVLASLACFAAYAADKSAARSRKRRVPERTLLMLGLCCGWPGALVAQRSLRHKTAKASFQVKFWMTVAANIGVLGWFVIWRAGSGAI